MKLEIRKTRNAVVSKVSIEFLNERVTRVGISEFPGYSGTFDMDIDYWLLIPEFQILIFLASNTKLPIHVNFSETIAISIGKITYSVAMKNLSEEIINYLAIRKADQYLQNLGSNFFIIDTFERCLMYKAYRDDFCFSSEKLTKIDTFKSFVLIKNLYVTQKLKRLQSVDIVDARILTRQLEYGNPRRIIVFVDSMREFLEKPATEYTTIAIVQRMNDDFRKSDEPFETVKMREKIWTGRLAMSESECYTP